MSSENNRLKFTGAISGISGPFYPGRKPLLTGVPIPHLLRGLFAPHKTPCSIAGIAILILLSAILLPPAARAETLTLEQLVAKTQEVYDKTLDLKAHFIQEVTIRSMKKTEKEEGTVTIKNPRMMYWDYSKPKAKKLIINAQKAWLFVPEDRMVYVQKSDDVYRSRMAVKFLSGIGKLSEDFQIRFARETPIDDEGNYHLSLTAKETGGIDKLYLTIDGKNFQILQCRFNDALGNSTRLRFSEIRLNTGVPDRFFTFKAPEGVEEVVIP